MNAAALFLILAVAAVGVLHTAVPDHWLPIALMARERGWSQRETARAAAQAGAGHVLSTLAIALAVWIAGAAFAERYGRVVDFLSRLARNRARRPARTRASAPAQPSPLPPSPLPPSPRYAYRSRGDGPGRRVAGAGRRRQRGARRHLERRGRPALRPAGRRRNGVDPPCASSSTRARRPASALARSLRADGASGACRIRRRSAVPPAPP